MTQLVKMLFGSHVYGCNTPASDTDYKGVYIPSARELLLGRQPKTSINSTTGQQNSRNTADDVDEEMFTLQGFLRMVAEGQVVALDMLFTPDEFLIEQTPDWFKVQEFAKAHLLSKTTTAYIGYCRKQASKYGIKGSRVGEVRDLLALLNTFPDKTAKLFEHDAQLTIHCGGKEFTEIKKREKGTVSPNYWANMLLSCCGRQVSMTARVREAVEIYQRLFDAYGARALMAETSQGVDWKAMHHAARCCYEAIELLTTRHITFPLHERKYLMQIKQGELPYPEVADKLERLMEDVDRQANLSSLPDQPDWEALDEFVFNIYKKEISHA